jgi:multiple sugar transport system substrate-binding protein
MTRTTLTRRDVLSHGAAAGGLLALLAACAPGSSAGSSDTAAAKSKAPATIHLGERAINEEEAFNVRLPVFKEQFPYITVQRDVITGDMIAALRTMAAANTLPDNIHLYTGGNEYHSFAVMGALKQVDTLIARDKVDLKGWFPEMVEIMKIDGKMYGLPFKGQVLTGGFFYNKNLFQARGLAEPNENWTLDDLIKAAQLLTVRQGSDTTQWGYAINTWGGENFNGHMRQWGGDTYSKDGKKATMDSPQVLEGLQWYDTLFNKERILHPVADAATDFQQGKVAMIGRTYFNYKATLLPQVGDKFVWDGMMMPKHPKTAKRGGMFAGDTHSVSHDSKVSDQAFELMKFVTDHEFGVALALQSKGSVTPGGRPDVYGDQRILNAPQYPRQAQKTQLASVSEIKEPFSAPANFRAADIAAVRDPAVTKITTGEAKPDQGYLRDLNAQLQTIMDMPRP